MRITRLMAEALCQDVIESFQIWGELTAALQNGGLEASGRGRIATAIEKWIKRYKWQLGVLPEYKPRKSKGFIDFALFNPATVGRQCLKVTTLFEVKFNYAKQLRGRTFGEAGMRMPKALKRARHYKRAAKAASAYILYLVAAPYAEPIPKPHRDKGWRHWASRKTKRADIDHAIAAIEQVAANRFVGGYCARNDASWKALYCCVIRAHNNRRANR